MKARVQRQFEFDLTHCAMSHLSPSFYSSSSFAIHVLNDHIWRLWFCGFFLYCVAYTSFLAIDLVLLERFLLLLFFSGFSNATG